MICPIVIPLDADAENFLKNSNPQDGWKELGDILLALRAHDDRIEDRLAELMTLYLPPEPEVVKTILGIAHEETRRMSYWEHVGRPGAAEQALQEVLDGAKRASDVFARVSEPPDPRGNHGSRRRIPDRDDGQADRAKPVPQRQEQGERRNRAPHGRGGAGKTGREDRDAGQGGHRQDQKQDQGHGRGKGWHGGHADIGNAGPGAPRRK